MSTLRPNILFMLSDDHATEAVGAYRERLAPWAQTVRIDRLASQGILAERYFVTTSLCSPSRASIITGRYAHSHGVLGVGIYSLLKQDENPSLPAELQAAAGYETALFGKWHLHGDSGGGKRRYPGAEKTWQAPRGFSTFNIVRGLGKYRAPIMYEGEFAESNAKEHSGHSSEVFAKLAIGWLEGTWKRPRARPPPFALFVHFRGVHEPWQFPERLQSMHDGVSVDDWPLPPSAGNATCSGSDSGVRAGDNGITLNNLAKRMEKSRR